MAKELVSIPYSDTFTSRERLTLLGNIDKLSNAIGECERIHQTSVPLNYARHALRSLTLWLLTLPFALVKDLGLITGPVVGITAWLMFGIYQIGHSIEDPFQKTLRLSILCNAIRRDVLGETEYRISAFSLDDSSEHMVHEQSPLPNPSFQ
jgi:predicted membrane chloride channel (bestrophin family)